MITILADFKVKPECVDEFIRLAAICTRNSRKENGNLSYKVFRRRYDDTAFVFVEEWLNDAVIEMHNQMPHFKEFIEQITPMTECKPEITQIMTIPQIR